MTEDTNEPKQNMPKQNMPKQNDDAFKRDGNKDSRKVDTVKVSQPTPVPKLEKNHLATNAQSTSNTPKSPWLWLLPLLLVTLGLGLVLGRAWQSDQASASLNDTALVTTEDASWWDSLLATLGFGEEEVEVLPAKPVLTVEVITPQQATVPNLVTADGTIVPKNVATVNSKVNGVTLQQVLVEEGDRVDEGQVLAVFDTDAMEQQAYQAEADLVEAQSRLLLAQSDVDRITPLLQLQAISEQERDRYVANANQAAASVEAAKARLSQQNLSINNAQVVAPVSGIISERNADVGSVAGQGPLFTIIENGTLEWQAQLDPSYVNGTANTTDGNSAEGVSVGTPVQVNLPQDNIVAGRVSRIAPTADSSSRQISVYATLADNPSARAGMYQRGTFYLGQQTQQILPSSAIVTEDGYDYIMLVKEDKDINGEDIFRIERYKVSLGERQNNAVVLTEPLPENTAIVRQGGSFLTDGDVVTIANLTAPTNPASAG